MKRNPLYVFKGLTDRGIYEVPLNSTVYVLDDGFQSPKFVEILSKEKLNPSSTIAEFLLLPDHYVDINKALTVPSELEKLVNDDGKIGWRIFKRDKDYYGEIGENAIDFSVSKILSQPNDPMGAVGINSFAVGENAQAIGDNSIAIGQGTTAITAGSIALGAFNIPAPNTVLTIGNGDSRFNVGRKNALEVYKDGYILSPTTTTLNINTEGTGKILVTREYLEDPTYGNIPMSYIGAPNGIVPLDNHPTDPKIPAEYLPSIAITNVFTVDYVAEMIALNAHAGDVCVVAQYVPDNNIGHIEPASASFIHNGGILGDISDWTELHNYEQVWSINGKTGVVLLGLNDLNDVDVTGLVTGSIIGWDGNKWKPVNKNGLGKQRLIELDDTPATYTGQDGMIMTVDEATDGVVFTNVIDGGTFAQNTMPLP